MHHYVDLRDSHYVSGRDPLMEWYRDLDAFSAEAFAVHYIHPDVKEWLREITPGRHHVRAYVVPFVAFKTLIGFNRASDAMLFKLAWV